MDNQSQYTEEGVAGTLFIKDVDRIDCATFEPNQGVTGKSWYVDIYVTGILDSNGFVHDFSLLKKLVKNVLKSTIDHSLLIPIQSKQVAYETENLSELWTLNAKARLSGVDSTWVYKCPKGAVYPVRCVKISREILEQECRKLIRHRLPEDVHDVKVVLRKEGGKKDDSFFRYTHGITGHEGLCQRLFHGHRSLIEVYVADEQRPDIERYIAHDLFGSIIHIASLDQVIKGESALGVSKDSKESTTLSYEGTHGYFEATIPTNRIFFVSHFTSIECIAREIADHIIEKFNLRANVRVVCYEGIGKGAVAEG